MFVIGPQRASKIERPIIQPAATGLIMNGSRKTTRKNFASLDVLIDEDRHEQRDGELDGNSDEDKDQVVLEGIPETVVFPHAAEVVQPAELTTVDRVEPPVGEGDVDAEDGREDDEEERDDDRGEQKETALELEAGRPAADLHWWRARWLRGHLLTHCSSPTLSGVVRCAYCAGIGCTWLVVPG